MFPPSPKQNQKFKNTLTVYCTTLPIRMPARHCTCGLLFLQITTNIVSTVLFLKGKKIFHILEKHFIIQSCSNTRLSLSFLCWQES